MPVSFDYWRREEPSEPGMEICPTCDGWGGFDKNTCHGFSAKIDWQDCFECHGRGEVIEQIAHLIRENRDP